MKRMQGILLIMVMFQMMWCVLSLAEDTGNSSMLNQFITMALENNPRLEAAIQRTLSAEKAISQAGALPDPQFTFGLMNLPVNSFSFTQEPMTGKVFSVMQMFPFPGKLPLATEIAEHEASSVKYQQEEVRNQVVQMVKLNYYNIYMIDRALETTGKNRALMEQFIALAETKYATGSGLQQDVLRARVELSKLEDDIIMWQQKRISAVAMLNALLNRAPETVIDEIDADLTLPADRVPVFSISELEQRRPLLKAWQERIQKADAAVKLADRDVYPNITVGTSYSQRSDLSSGMQMHDFFSASVSVNIPIFLNRKQRGKIAEKTYDFEAARAEYANVKISILAEIEGIKAELERNRKRAELYANGILLQAQQSLESAQAGYRVGKVDFLTLINNWMMLQNYELQYYTALADFYKNLANYEFATGGRLSL